MVTVDALLAKLDIRAVYWIDDDNAREAEFDLKKACSSLAARFVDGNIEQRNGVKGVFLNLLPVKDRGKSAKAFDIPEKVEEEERQKQIDECDRIFTEILGQTNDTRAAMDAAFKCFSNVLAKEEKEQLKNACADPNGDRWTWNAWSFTQWRDQHQTLSGSTTPQLFIVDLENSSEAALTDGNSVIEALSTFIAAGAPIHVIVLTATFKADEELAKGRALTDKFPQLANGLPLFALSKLRFRKDPSALSVGLVAALQRVLASKAHSALAADIRTEFSKAIEVALAELKSLTVEELIYAVSGTSEKEGAPELETLIRIVMAAQRRALLVRIAGNPELRQSVALIRESKLDLKEDDLSKASVITRLRGAELYDGAEVINKMRSQLFTGDIFQVTSEGEGKGALYVLALNACDVTLRPTGKRKALTSILLPTSDELPNAEEQNFELPHITTVAEGLPTQYIRLSKFESVPLEVLDLCWTNDDGECRWDGSAEILADPRLTAGQALRQVELKDKFTAPVLYPLRFPTIFVGQLGCTPILDNAGGGNVRVNFGLKRIGRLSMAHATQLSARFGQCLGRPSAEHDFSRG